MKNYVPTFKGMKEWGCFRILHIVIHFSFPDQLVSLKTEQPKKVVLLVKVLYEAQNSGVLFEPL